MEYNEAKEKFINAWGSLATQWGINRAMAQIHALLLISTQPLCVEDIMEELQISRGNVSMNLRQLMDWGIVYKDVKFGERREYFNTQKDIQELARIIVTERSKREIQPTIRLLQEVSSIKGNGSPESNEFKKVTSEMYEMAKAADDIVNKVVTQKSNWLTSLLIKILR